MSKPDDIVHLHVHSDMSNLDGCGKIPDYVAAAKARGHRGVAFTDHGTMRGYMTQHEQCKEHDVKPVYGLEFYVSPDMRRRGLTEDERADITRDLPKSEHKAAIKKHEEHAGIRDRWHLTVWALDQVGLQNLYRLSSAAWIEGFYYKPRIDLDELIKYGVGLAVGSGCLASPINDCWVLGRQKQALGYADRLADAFGDRLYLEVMPHAIRDQRLANGLMLKLRKRYGSRGVRLLATQDAHYVEQADACHHEVLLCIGTNSILSDPERFKFDGNEFHFKTRKEMIRSFRRNHEFMPDSAIREALNTTLELAERVSAKVEVDYHKALLPDSGIPAKCDGNAFAYLRDLCLDGWKWREIPKRAAAYAAVHGVSKPEALAIYRDRMKYEMGALVRQRFVPYFLMVHDIYRFAREAHIMTGPGRGSVAGSLVAYCLGLTAVDPIEFGLIFERFINPDRIDMPDVDMDFEDRRRSEIMDYLRAKYGEDKVCQIATIGKLSGKQCIRDVSRVLQVPLNEVNQVTASIIERSSGDERASQTIEDSFQEFAVCRAFNKRHPEVLEHARKLEGMAKNLGIHAAGVVASPVPLTDLLPLEIRKHDGRDLVVSAVDMYGVASTGLVKLDVLGLRTLTVIKETLEAIDRRHGRHIDMESRDIDLNDPKVLQGFTDHNFGGVFQYDTTSAAAVCRGVKFAHFEDVAALTALNRPGTSRSGLATEYVRRKKKPKEAEKDHFHPLVSKITKDTLGIIVYQEHVIRIFIEVAGFAPGTADSLRKTIAKKIGDEAMGKERENFIRGAWEHSRVDRATAAKIMDAITFFGCVPFWTQIAIPLDGERSIGVTARTLPIDLVRPGDEVWSVDEHWRLVRNRVKNVVATGRKPLFRIVAKIHDGNRRVTVEATAGHYWLLVSGKYAKTEQLKSGDVIAYRNRTALRVDVAIVQLIEPVEFVGDATTYDLEVENEPHNYVADGFVCHNSYGFNKTVGRSAMVWKAGANASDPRGQVSIGEIADRWNERKDGTWSPMARKLRYGRFKIIQMDEDGRCRPARLIGIHDHGVQRVYRLKTKSGIETPPISRNHRLMTSEGYKSIATGLGPGDALLFMGENKGHDYCSWFAGGDRQFAQSGRVNDAYRATVAAVWKRDGGKCSECGAKCEHGRGGSEVAHIWSPAECDYNKALFHSEANLRLLCNSCHKRLDYEKGERQRRWSKGRPTFADEVVEVIDSGEEHCYDLEVDAPGHNFVTGPDGETPPVVSHNSHATAYGMIAFWCVHGQTRLLDWSKKEYTTVARAYREGTSMIACYDERTGGTIGGKVKCVIRTGKKKVWEVRLRSYKTLRCSSDHLILTDEGYKKASCLRVGDLVASEKRLSPSKRESVKKKLRRAAKEQWAGLSPEQRASMVSKAHEALTPEFRREHVWRGTAEDGHKVYSWGEKLVGDWLSSRGLEHETQPSVGRGKRADFICQGVYVEYDGMRREESYWEDKFGDLPYVVVKPGDDLDDVLSFLVETGKIVVGEEVAFEPVVFARKTERVALMYDVVMEGEPHNFLANNIVVHNCMWLKTYYPLEFYWALLKNEPDRLRIQQFAKDAKQHGIALLPPHVNVSDDVFAIDDARTAIRGSLVDIKGVGKAAAKAVIANKPYRSLLDLVDRVERRAVHRGVVVALASAGALEGMLPNTRHFVENIDAWWKVLTAKAKRAKKLRELLAAARAEPDWPPEDRDLLASRVNPLAFGAHPVEAHLKAIGHRIMVPAVTMADEDFFKRHNSKGVYVMGMVVEVKYNQIGDFNTGELPSETEKRRMFWGSRYANINIEERTGTQNRFKVDFHIFDDHRAIVDKGVGTPLVAFATPMAFTGTFRAHFLVDMEVLRAKLTSGDEMDVWENIVTGRHPALVYRWASESVREERSTNAKFEKYGGHFCGVVTHIQPKYDRKGGLMAYLGLLAGDGRYERVLVFASVWQHIKRKLKRGMLVRMELERKPDRGGWTCFYNGGHVKFYNRKIPAATPADE